MNEQRKILGYRIYIDDQLKGAIGPGQFEAIIDSIRDEGEYRIKIRTFDQNGESADSNVVVARFRRQRSTTIEETPKNPSEFFIDINDKRDENLVNSTREDTRAPIVLEKRWSDSAIPMFQQENPISASTPEKIPVEKRFLFSSFFDILSFSDTTRRSIVTVGNESIEFNSNLSS